MAKLEQYKNAKSQGYNLCERCESLVDKDFHICPVCDAPTHSRKNDSVMLAWMWVLTSAILYIPAMYFPVSVVEYLGKQEPTTLMQTVIHFIHGGSWPVALVIFVASVFIPAFKILSIIYILYNINKKNITQTKSRQVTKMYHFVEFIGRWSMIDVFVVALLVALVRFGGLATIIPGMGVFCFAGVVLTSMFSANSIDIRLLWDNTDVEEH